MLHLDYVMQACLPNLFSAVDCLQQIQRLSTRPLNGFCRLPYEERLRWLGLHSLNRRRLHGDVITAYNVFLGVVKYWNSPTPHLYSYHSFRQFIQAPNQFFLGVSVCRGPVISHLSIPPTPTYAIPFYITPSMLVQPLNHCHSLTSVNIAFFIIEPFVVHFTL